MFIKHHDYSQDFNVPWKDNSVGLTVTKVQHCPLSTNIHTFKNNNNKNKNKNRCSEIKRQLFQDWGKKNYTDKSM